MKDDIQIEEELMGEELEALISKGLCSVINCYNTASGGG